MIFFLSSRFFGNYFFQILFWEQHKVSNSLDPDQALCSVGPDLGPNCLQRSWADKELKRHFLIIRIYHECEGGIEKSVLRITDWHHEACRVMTNGDQEGPIFLSHPPLNNGFFFLLTTSYLIYIGKNLIKPSRKSWIRRDATLQWRHGSTYSQCAAVRFLSFPRAGTGMWDGNISNV